MSAAVRRAAAALATAGLSAGLLLAAPATAGAAPDVMVACSAAGESHFSPGVEVFPLPQRIAYRGTDGSCDDHSGVGIRSARIDADLHGVITSCVAGGLGTGEGSATVVWTLDDGTMLRSTLNLSIDHTVLNSASVSGEVVGGSFVGQHFSGTFRTDLFGGAGKCTAGALFGGVRDADFTGDYTIG